jgi:glycosyltransferase involved in cell wall biosynthesis
MSASPSVSVIIATYNRAAFLAETIDSVLGQRFPDFELIVVDDGSTDDTREVLAAYGEKVRVFRQQNRGPSAARNLGARYARGAWLSIQDSDDLAAPDHLEALLGFAAGRRALGMVFANGAYLGGEFHDRRTIIPEGKSRRLARRGVRLADLFDKSIVRLQAALIAKEAFDAVGGFDETLRISMDLDLSFRLFMRYPVAYLDRVVFFYRKHEGNIGRDQERRLTENIYVIEKLLSEHPQAERLLGRSRVARRLAYRYYRLAKSRWQGGARSGALEAIKKAIALRPLSLKYRLYKRLWMLSDARS